jgi:hypothetical protein
MAAPNLDKGSVRRGYRITECFDAMHEYPLWVDTVEKGLVIIAAA